MVIQARINEDEMFHLCTWSATNFNATPTLWLQSSDLNHIKEVFSHIEKIEIYQNNYLTATYAQYDTYESISYGGTMFVEHENIFADYMIITLCRSSLADEVAQLQDIITPTYDIDAMDVDEYRSYLKKQIGDICRQEIYQGTQVQLPSGAVEYYTYNADDQQNLANSLAILTATPDIEEIVYHPNGGVCRVMSPQDLVEIYITLHLRLIDLSTRANLFNVWMQTITTKEELLEISWDTELPQEYQEQAETIHESTLNTMNTLRDWFDHEDENE